MNSQSLFAGKNEKNIVSLADNLHKMPTPIFREKEGAYFKLSSAECFYLHCKKIK